MIRERANVTRLVAMILAAFGLLVLFSSYARQPVEAHAPVNIFSRYLDTLIPELLQQYGVPGANIALIRHGKLVWSGSYGYADWSRKQPMTIDALFRVESIAKPVTTWGIFRLVEQGLVNIDTPVQPYLGTWQLPHSIYGWQEVTVRRLLSHNAGLPLGTIGPGMEYSPLDDPPSLREILLREVHLVREPGTGFSYSNTGFNLLELLVEQVSGQGFSQYMAREVLLPLGMHSAVFGWDEARRSTIPTGYDLHGIAVPEYIYPVQGAGGLLATVEDIAHFVSAGMTVSPSKNHSVLSSESIRQIHTPQVDIPGLFSIVADAYGLGHFIEYLPDGQQAVWHGGQGHGWMSHFHSVPQAGDGIVILTNSQRSWPFMVRLLSDWAGWSGHGSVKMGRILYGIAALQLFIVIVVLISLLQAYRLLKEVISGRRRFSPFSRKHRKKRLLEMVLAVNTVALLVWAASQPYLILSSLFPGVAGWAGIAILLLAIIVALSALLPRISNHHPKKEEML